MSAERWLLVALGPDDEDAAQARALDARARSALHRAERAPAGDRTDIVRYERAQADLEILALRARSRPASDCATGNGPVRALPEGAVPSALVSAEEALGGDLADLVRRWRGESRTIIEVCWPFAHGATAPSAAAPVRGPALTWRAPDGVDPRDAAQERFRAQLRDALNGREDAAITPSTVSNRTLTRGLREFAARHAGARRVDAPVVYQDGSSGRPFPLAALDLADDPSPLQRHLAFSLLSIRHVALDARVDGAWLRNTEISRPRAMGDTDELVYEQSRAQLRGLTDAGPVSLEMYQTGLPSAIVGFYRAVADELERRPGSLVVLPRFYRRDRDYARGVSWRTP